MLFRRKHIAVLAMVLTTGWLTGCSSGDGISTPAQWFQTFKVTIENVATAYDYGASGVANTPVGAPGPGAIGPGDMYEFTFSATPGSKLSFASMFVPSNDFFYGPDEMGIDLFDATGAQISGDVTAMVKLWDAGTEINQEPGLGPDQPQRQTGADTGVADPDNSVRMAPDTFTNLPAVADVLRATLSATPPTEFTLRIENVSNGTTLTTSDAATQAVPLAPVAWVVHTDNGPLFTAGQNDYSEGLSALAEDGDPSGLATFLASISGVTHLFAPGVWAIHTGSSPLFTASQVDPGMGLEALAEDGDPSALASAVDTQSGVSDSGVFNTPAGAAGPGALAPGNSYEFTFTVTTGEKLSFATMLVQSNDLFYATGSAGMTLTNSGQLVSGDITDRIMLWDAGTEMNEAPGLGLNQPPRQSGPNTGANEGGLVRAVNDGFTYPATNSIIRVTLTPQ